jgi:hypothetical protein
MKAAYLYAFAIAATVACAPPASTSGGHSSSIITADEIAASRETYVYDVVQKLRPNFLRSRGTTSVNPGVVTLPNVYIDGNAYGDISSMKQVLASTVREIRYYDAASGSARFGMQNSSGVIELRTK